MKANLTEAEPDYGFDHYEHDADGKCIRWRLVPSGRIVDKAGLEVWRASRPKRNVSNEILGMSWNQLEAKQGGKLRH